MLPELLGEIIKRVEASEESWPLRQNVVACGCVCKRWRQVTEDVVESALQNGKITFPSCLKQVKIAIFFNFFVQFGNFVIFINWRFKEYKFS